MSEWSSKTTAFVLVDDDTYLRVDQVEAFQLVADGTAITTIGGREYHTTMPMDKFIDVVRDPWTHERSP